MKIVDMLRLTPQQRANLYKAQGIDKVIIDGNEITDYSAFSFAWVKSFPTEPKRSSAGVIGNLNAFAWFLTPRLTMDFSLMSIDTYRIIMNLIYSKNEFTVTCYDVVFNELTTNKMYFTPEEMPNLWTVVEAINGDEYAVELLGVQGYKVEMIGTNNDVEQIEIEYKLNVPSGINWVESDVYYEQFAKNTTTGVGNNATVDINGTVTRMSNITFNGKYIFKYWNTKKDGTGFNYIDGEEYMFRKGTTLYAIWEVSA
jgi:hypothetical protein